MADDNILFKRDIKMSTNMTFFSKKELPVIAEAMSRAIGRDCRFLDEVAPAKFRPDYPVVTRAFSEGYDMYRASLPLESYERSKVSLLSAMHVVESMGYTTDACRVGAEIEMPEINRGLNLFNLTSRINESEMIKWWSRWGASKLYPMKTSHFHPRNIYMAKPKAEMYESWDSNEMSYPVSEMFGLGFGSVKNGMMSINYIGGVDYEKKTRSVAETLDGVAAAIIGANTPDMNEGYNTHITADNFANAVKATREPDSFMRSYPGINLLVDMKCDALLLQSMYGVIRESLFKLVTYGGVRSGNVNYNSDTRRIQISDMKIRQGFMLEGLDMLNCVVSADIRDCTLMMCKVTTSSMRECRMMDSNDIRNSRLYECEFGGNENKLRRCYVDGGDKVTHAKLERSMVVGKVSYSYTKK